MIDASNLIDVRGTASTRHSLAHSITSVGCNLQNDSARIFQAIVAVVFNIRRIHAPHRKVIILSVTHYRLFSFFLQKENKRVSNTRLGQVTEQLLRFL